MVDCPVLKEARAKLSKDFEEAKRKGLIPSEAPLVIKSFGRKGTLAREYCCVDDQGNVFPAAGSFVATPTISDFG